MASERKREASRRNAQKSTGPRTAEGKARSRANALKHGLSGKGVVLPPEDRALFEERLAKFGDDARPEGTIEGYLVTCLALASVRIDRCAREEFAEVARRRNEAIDGWLDDQARSASRLARRLAEEPAGTLAALQEFAGGCDWLIDRWQELAAALDAPDGGWTEADVDMALRLLGKVPGHDDPQFEALYAAAALSASPEQAESGEARSRLRAFARREQARLEQVRDALWRESDGPDLAETINLSTLDDSPQGILRHRYHTAASSVLFRSLDRLAKERKEGPAKASRRGQPFNPTTLPCFDLTADWVTGAGLSATSADEGAARARRGEQPDELDATAPDTSARPTPSAPAADPFPPPAGPAAEAGSAPPDPSLSAPPAEPFWTIQADQAGLSDDATRAESRNESQASDPQPGLRPEPPTEADDLPSEPPARASTDSRNKATEACSPPAEPAPGDCTAEPGADSRNEATGAESTRVDAETPATPSGTLTTGPNTGSAAESGSAQPIVGTPSPAPEGPASPGSTDPKAWWVEARQQGKCV